MSIFDYSGCIKITFDKPIVSELDIIESSSFSPDKTIITNDMVSMSSGGGTKANAIDNDFGTRAQFDVGAFPAWYKVDFGAEKTFGKFRIYTAAYQYPVTAFILQGSDDASTWDDIANGTIGFDSSGWTTLEFSPRSYRYWRMYVTAGWNSYAAFYEFELYETVNIYRTSGWEVYAQENNRIPDGEALKTNYTLKRITKSEDNLSVFLRLDLPGRIKYPIGDITVKLTGTILGPYGADVAPFEIPFTPTLPVKIFNPNDVESLTSSTTMTISFLEVVYTSVKLEESITSITGVTIVVTNVGGLPL